MLCWINNWLHGRATHGASWCPVTAGVPQGSALASASFSIFSNAVGKGIECTLSEFVNDTKLSGSVGVLESKETTES